MKVLRLYIDRDWEPSRPASWVLHYDGSVIDHGTSSDGGYPTHDALDAVLSAGQVRILVLALPRLPAARLAQAARFALEDQIAGAEADAHVAIAEQREDGTLLAFVCPRARMSTLAARKGALARLRRVIAEPALAIPVAANAWRWCSGGNSGNDFVRVANGEAFASSAPDATGALPPELRLALTRAGAGTVGSVHVEWPATADSLEQWTRDTGIAFVARPPWRWDGASAQAFDAATDLLQGDFRSEVREAQPSLHRTFAPAVWLLGAALALHVLATLGEWTAQRIATWRADAEWSALGVAAGLPRESLATPASARAALDRRHTDVLHAQHQFARTDALPLLARMSAGPPAGAIPAGAIRRATYADRHWTFETNLQDPAQLQDVERRLRAADLEALVVAAPGGARVRVGTSR